MSVVFVPLSNPVAGEETRGNLISYNTLKKLDRSTNEDVSGLFMRGRDLEVLEVDESELAKLGKDNPDSPPVEIKEVTKYEINLGAPKLIQEWSFGEE